MEWYYKVIIGIAVSIVLVLLVLAIIGVIHHPKSQAIDIVATKGGLNRTCLTEKVACTYDADCNICRESEEGRELVCKQLNRYTKDQISEYGPTQGVCVPADATMECNEERGGLLTWAGWGDPARMEWDCLCSYPSFAGGPNCSPTPGVCDNGVMDWSVASTKSPPSSSQCKCNAGFTLKTRERDLTPICVPDSMTGETPGSPTVNPYKDFYKGLTRYPGPKPGASGPASPGCASV